MIDPRLKQGHKWLETRQDKRYPLPKKEDKFALPPLSKPARLVTKCECGAENPLSAEICAGCGQATLFAVKNKPEAATANDA